MIFQDGRQASGHDGLIFSVVDVEADQMEPLDVLAGTVMRRLPANERRVTLDAIRAGITGTPRRGVRLGRSTCAGIKERRAASAVAHADRDRDVA
jgi:hypothetical protein